MVDRDKVIKGLESCLENRECPFPCYCEYAETWPHELHKETLELLKEQNWISVNDRLPNCNGCYLVWRPRFYQEKGMPSICYFDGSNTWHDSYGVDFTRILNPEDVSHWMELPKMPDDRR